MQRSLLGTPLMDNFQLFLDNEFKKVNSFENLENTLLKVGGRVGDLMDVVQEAMNPDSPLGKDLSKKEINDFLENLTQAQFTAIQKFFASMPKLTHEVKLTHPKTKKKGTVKLQGLRSFF